MANRNAAYGLSPVSHISGSEWNEAGHRYYIPASDVNSYAIGDLVKTTAGADLYGVQQITLAAASDTARGSIVGLRELPTLNNVSFVPATKVIPYYVNVVDDPNTIFMIQEGGSGTALSAANVGSYANILYAANNRFVSGTMLDNASISTSFGALNLHILGLAATMNNSYGANAKWLVMIANHDLRTAPVAGSGNVITLTTSRALVSGDNGATLVYSGAGALTLTVPAGLPVNFGCAIVQYGAGQITISGSGATVSNVSSFTMTSGQYAVMTLLAVGTDLFVLAGSGA